MSTSAESCTCLYRLVDQSDMGVDLVELQLIQIDPECSSHQEER